MHKSVIGVLERALGNGAIVKTEGPAVDALAHVARHDPASAEQFASRARSAEERARLALSVNAPGTTLEESAQMFARMNSCTYEDALAFAIKTYGG